MNISIPPGCEPYANDIRVFVHAMLFKLQKNVHKGRWEGRDVPGEFQLLKKEVEELKEAIGKGNVVDILLEAADVANFAMIVASVTLID